MSDINKEIGERLKKARERAGYKQNAIANWLGIHNSTLAKYESGDREVDNKTLLSLCEKYDITTEWLMTGSVESNPGNSSDQLQADPGVQFIMRARQDLSPQAYERFLKLAQKMKESFEEEEDE